MTDNEKQFENFVRGIKFDDSPDPNHRDKLEQNLLATLAKQSRQKETPLIIWRTIMKSSITKLVAAAVIIVAVGLSITFLDKSVRPAYAIEQTIEAMRNISTVHIFGRDWDDRSFEIWIKVDPETDENDHFYMDAPEHGLLAVSTPKESYLYDKTRNIVTYSRGQGLTTKIRFHRFFEDVMENIIKPKNGRLQISKEYDPEREKEVIVVLAEAGKVKFKTIIDPETNLPIYMDMISDVIRPGHIGKSLDEIYYDEPLPDGIFEFEIPEGATVTEKQQD